MTEKRWETCTIKDIDGNDVVLTWEDFIKCAAVSNAGIEKVKRDRGFRK